MSDKQKTKILLVDDHEMVREGLVVFLSTQPDFEVIGQADNGQQAIEMLEQMVPDIILMDLIMPLMDGIQATGIIKKQFPNIEIIALTSYVDDEKVIGAIKAGISGYVMKDANPAELARAIRTAASGEIYLVPAAARFLAKKMRPELLGAKSQKEFDVITPREIEVLQLVAKGFSNPAIAAELSISIKTVKVHVSNIMRKTHLESRVQIVLYALIHEYVTLEDIDLNTPHLAEE